MELRSQSIGDNILIQEEQVLRGLRGAGVLGVQGRKESRRLAVVVELLMDVALWKDGPLESTDVEPDLARERSSVLAVRVDEAVLEDVAGGQVAPDDGQPLSGARVGMGRIHVAGLEEANGGGDTLFGEDGEGSDVGELESAALASHRGFVEVENNALLEVVVGEEIRAVAVDGEKLIEALHVGDFGRDPGRLLVVAVDLRLLGGWDADGGGDHESLATSVGFGAIGGNVSAQGSDTACR